MSKCRLFDHLHDLEVELSFIVGETCILALPLSRRSFIIVNLLMIPGISM